MNLVSIKIKKLLENPEDILRIFLAFVFLSAGTFRIFHPEVAASEFFSLGMPIIFAPLMVVFEISSGIGLLLNKCTDFIYLVLIIFVVFALNLALIINWQGLLASAGELFIFNVTPTDWFLHFVFLVIALTLLIKKNKK